MSDLQLTPMGIKKVVTFKCGCIVEYPLLGHFFELKDWHVIPCFNHTESREELAKAATHVWDRAIEDH